MTSLTQTVQSANGAMDCERKICRAPVACESFGYCRQLNIKHGVPQFSEKLPDGCYQSWVGDIDLGMTIGYGATRREAAQDLMDRLEE